MYSHYFRQNIWRLSSVQNILYKIFGDYSVVQLSSLEYLGMVNCRWRICNRIKAGYRKDVNKVHWYHSGDHEWLMLSRVQIWKNGLSGSLVAELLLDLIIVLSSRWNPAPFAKNKHWPWNPIISTTLIHFHGLRWFKSISPTFCFSSSLIWVNVHLAVTRRKR